MAANAPDERSLTTEAPAGRVEVIERPLHERLAVGGPLHGPLLARLQQMITSGGDHVAQRHDAWRKADENTQLYVDYSRAATRGDRSEIPKTQAIPFERAVVVPVTYWSAATRQATKWLILMSRDPLVHLEARGSEDQKRARLMEARLRWDLEQTSAAQKLYQMSWDDERYGICGYNLSWREDLLEEEYSEVPGMSLEAARAYGLQTMRRDRVVREWNDIEPIDPYQLILDPEAPANDLKRARYVGYFSKVPWLDLYEQRFDPATGRGIYINLKAAREVASGMSTDASGRGLATGTFGVDEHQYPHCELGSLQTRIIPREWELSTSGKPEYWWFATIGNQVVVRAHPAVVPYKEYSIVLGSGEPDIHAPFVPSHAEHNDGMQTLATWLASSHIQNTQRALNDAVAYDPMLISRYDLTHPNAGARHVRVTREGSALIRRGMVKISDMVYPLPAVDITSQHLGTLRQVIDWVQRESAANDLGQGQPLPDRRTLGEVQELKTAAGQRIGISAQMLDLQLLKPYADRSIAQINAFATVEQWLRIAGDLVEQLGGLRQVLVRPGDLAGVNYDYIPHTATSAPDPSRQSAVWANALGMLMKAGPALVVDPVTGKRINLSAVFNEWLRVQGIRYFDQFYMTPPPPPPQAMPGAGGMAPRGLPAGPGPTGPGGPPRVMDDGRLQEQVRQGNIVPLAAALRAGLGRQGLSR